MQKNEQDSARTNDDGFQSSSINADTLRVLANEASHGPWLAVERPDGIEIVEKDSMMPLLLVHRVLGASAQANAAFIAWCGTHREILVGALRQSETKL